MAQWLSWLFGWCKRDHEESYDFYRPKERKIFGYYDGTKDVHADPMVLYRRLMECGTDLNVDIKIANSPSKDAVKAYAAAVRRIRTIFSIKPYDEAGLTEPEAFDLLNQFLFYCEQVKKNSSPSSISLKETSSPSECSSSASQPIENTSPSGSCVDESTTADPMTLPSESLSDSGS